MNKLNKIVGTICISAVSLISSANADSSAFTGGYVGVTGSAIGIALEGKHTRSTNSLEKHGATGMVGVSAGAEVGFSYPLTDMFFVTAGIGMTPFT